MRIKLVSFIKRQDGALREMESEYIKRIRKWVPCDVFEVAREKIERCASRKSILDAEFRRLGDAMRENAALIVLDKGGKEQSSEEFAHWLGKRLSGSEKELVFLIGGPLGLAEELVAKARWKLSLSKLTFPHKMVRVMVLEILYRSMTMLNGLPYHKSN